MHLFICVVSIILATSYAQNIQEKHDAGHLLIEAEGTKIFINIYDRMTQDEAFAYCHDHGYELISFITREKQFLVTDFLFQNVDQFLHYWTSGMRLGVESFFWNTGERLHITDSFPLPDHKEKNCVALVQIPRKLETFQLHTEHCNATNPVICEKINKHDDYDE